MADAPTKISDGKRDLDLAGLLRRLDTGQALVAAKKMHTAQSVNRAFVIDVRPRVRVHGGEAS